MMSDFSNTRRNVIRAAGLGVAYNLATGFASGQDHSAPSADKARPTFFDVRAFGATGKGEVLDSAAINAAIEAAAAVGGGTVYLPAGTYLCFSIRLKSNITLYLEQGAKILAAASPKPGETTGQLGGGYDAAEPNPPWFRYQDFGHAHWHNSLIWGEDLHDIAITGPGRIDGSGLSPGYGERDPAVFEQAGVGNKAIALKSCRNVTLTDFSILKGGWFAMLLTGIDNLKISGLTIDTNRDGMDIDCCRNVTVSDCIVNAPADDAICPKSSYALGYLRATENVAITNCIVSGGYWIGSVLDGSMKRYPASNKIKRNGRIKCGTESNGGFKNISIANCVFDNCYGIAIESVDGAPCEDITISNITMRDIIAGPLFVRLGARLRGPKPGIEVGTLRRILISNITSYNGASDYPSILSGIPGHSIEDVKISNVYSEHQGGGTAELSRKVLAEDENGYPDPFSFGPVPAQGFYLRHIRNLEMSHVEVRPMKPDARTSFYLQNVDRSDFIAVTAPKPAFTLNKVNDLRVLVSRAAPDTVLDHADGQQL